VPTYHYRVPQARSDGIAVAHVSRSDLGVETVERLVNSVLDGTNADVHGLLLYQRGALVLEEYFYGYSNTRPHQLRSATKSFVSAVAGIAVDRGAIAGPTARVASALRYAAFANPDQRKAAITLGDLLTMRPGLACNDYDATSPGRETVIDESPDWVRATMDLPMVTDPGTVAHYCSGAVAVTGGLVERSVGEPLPRYAQRHLFGPLGIPRDHWRWNHTLTNANKEYAQLHIRPRDLLKFGLLYANGGLWRGRRVLSESWVRASLAEQTQIDGTGYGYFWWRPWLNVPTSTGVQRVTFNAAQGNGGQKIYIIPELDLVAVFTGGDYNSGGSPPNRMMASMILPRLLEARR
jgi:CubicO group peptidase (beta-lactamase class C family)